MGLWSSKLRTAEGQRGNALILAGLAMPVLVGFAGLATDTIFWSLDKRQLQRSADSAAMAGVYGLAQGHDPIDSAQANLAQTNELVLSEPATIENAPTEGGYTGDAEAVRVVLRTQRALPFSSLFMASTPTIEVSATAAKITNGNYCVISLDTSNTTGIEVTGSAAVDLNCGMFANSRGANVVSAGGSASVRSTPVAGVGGLAASNRYLEPTELLPYSVPQPDPFADLPPPEPADCGPKVNVQPTQSVVLSPGCFRGMDIKGTATLQPGVYYIDGGELSFGSQANVTGTDVTFVLTSTNAATNPGSIATLDMNGGANIDLRAPTSGDYNGVLIYQDRRAATGVSNKINGNSSSRLQGAFYFPRQMLDFNGNSGLTTDCIQLIGYRVSFSGNSSISNNCPLGAGHDFRGTIVRIVE